MRCFFKHDMQTVAISTAHSWKEINGDESGDHIIAYIACSKCGHRDIEYLDASVITASYAENQHSAIAKARAIWLGGGSIQPSKIEEITWLNKSYAPGAGVDEIIEMMKNDEEFGKLIKDNPTVEDAVENLATAAKLCKGL